MYYYLKVKAPVELTEEELNTAVKTLEVRDDRILTYSEKRIIEDNLKYSEVRIGTFDKLDLLILNYSPHLQKLKNQLDYQEIRIKFRNFDYSKYNYFKFDEEEYKVIKDLLSHDNYANRTQDGTIMPLRDVGGFLREIFSLSSEEPEDFEIKGDSVG